jgi:hypothetical protein
LSGCAAGSAVPARRCAGCGGQYYRTCVL